MPYDDREVLVDDEGEVRVITLNRPHRLNAFTSDGYRLLADALRSADDNVETRVVLLQGAGRGFSSGVDLDALRHGDRTAFVREFGALIGVLTTLRKPVVASVQGVAIGFGATLLLHCDVVVVADDARLRFPFTQLGTAPEAGSSWLLPRTVGIQRAADLVLTSRWVPATEAVTTGLAARCVPPAALDATARELAHEIGAHKSAAVIAAKRLLKSAHASAVPQAVERELESARALASELGGF